MQGSRFLPWAAGVLAGALVLTVMPARGPALNPDAMSYLGAATSLAHHGTLRVPWAEWGDPDSTSRLADYPQGFSLLLAGPIALGAPPVMAARVVEAVGAAVTVGVAVGLVMMLAGPVAGGLTALLLIVMPAMVEIHLWVLSEPAFLALVALTVAALVLRPARPGLAGFFAALANLVRYAGASLVAATVVWCMAAPGTWRERWRRGALAAFPGIVLHVWWRLRGISPGGGVSLTISPGVGATLTEGWTTIRAWLVPGLTPGWGQTALSMVVLALVGSLLWRVIRAERDPRKFWGPLGLVVGCYVGLVVVARLFVIDDLPFDDRILAPLFLLVTIGVGMSVGQSPRGVRVAALTMAAFWIGAALRQDAMVIHEARFGLGYEVVEWQESAVAAWLRTHGSGRELYGNDPAGIYFLVHRPSRLLPSTLDADTVQLFAARFRRRPAALLQFDGSFVPSAPSDSLALRLGLHVAARFAHGAVWVEP